MGQVWLMPSMHVASHRLEIADYYRSIFIIHVCIANAIDLLALRWWYGCSWHMDVAGALKRPLASAPMAP